MLREPADSEPSERPGTAGNRSSKPSPRRDVREESELTEHLEDSELPETGEESEAAAARDAEETAEKGRSGADRNGTKRATARRRPSPAANGRTTRSAQSDQDATKQDAAKQDAESDEDAVRLPDAEDAVESDDGSGKVSEATGRAETEAVDESDGGKRRTAKAVKRTARERKSRAGDLESEATEQRPAAARQKRQTGTGSVRKDSRGKPGRKVVAAPRAGSNRRARAAQAAISRLKRIAVNLAVWTVVAAILAGVAWYLKDQGDQIDAASRDATAKAYSAAEAIFSYDYRGFDESVSNGKHFVTGKFKKEYAKTTSGIKATVKKEKAIVRAKVSDASVSDATATRVEVLLFVNQYRRNVNITGEKVDQNRVILTMVKVNGDWLVSDAAAI
jgi:Mce-associated membrane protein